MTDESQIEAHGFDHQPQHEKPSRRVWFRNHKPGESGKQEFFVNPKTGKFEHVLFGYGSQEAQEVLNANKQAFIEKANSLGFHHKENKQYIRFTPAGGTVDQAVELLDWVSGEVNIVVRGRGLRRKTEDSAYFIKTAKLIRHCVENETWDPLERGSLGFDAHDDLITIGSSKAVLADPSASTWREHLVPCVIVKEEAIRMVQVGDSDVKIAEMLKRNLTILIITQNEQEKLDARHQTTMPVGWKFGDSIFARLDAVKIDY
jgi:hypothetical protein